MADFIGLNPFVKRQTAASRFSHFDGTWEELVALVRRYHAAERLWEMPGNSKVRRLELPATVAGRFFSGVIEVEEDTELRALFGTRDRAVEGEKPFVQIVAVGGRKARAAHVDVILYHRDALTPEEKTDPETGALVDAEWQVISVNARDTREPEPPTPMAMARNQAARLGLPEGVGGTPNSYTAEEYMRSILYWSRRAMAASR